MATSRNRLGMRLGWLALCLWGLACQPARESSTPVRFIDQVPVEKRAMLEVGGETRPILPPGEPDQRFALDGAPARPILTFAAGLARFEGAGSVRFEIWLEPRRGDPVSLYSKDLDRAGWAAERIDLSAHALKGSHLLFRRTPRAGFGGDPPNGGWGDPALLPGEPPARPSVVLVSLDTLRADKVGAYGHERARTLALDQLAATGVRYERVYAPSTWTVPSHASLFYSAYLPESPAMLRERKLLPETTRLPERPIATILREAGYLTAGFTGGGFLAYPWDFFRGFGTYYAYPPPASPRDLCRPERFDGPEVFRRAIDWLRRNHDSPFFLFVHTYDPHDRCGFTPATMTSPTSRRLFAPWTKLGEEDRQRALDHYDRMIADTDRHLADLLATLDALGLRDDTLLIVTSDHGEVFTEHGQAGHGCDMKPYEELARVPLLVRFPGRAPAGERVVTPVSLIDVAPTILALLGLPGDPALQGGILPGLGVPGSPRPSEPVYSHCGDALAVWRGQHKLITSRNARHLDEIYDLSKDPREETPLGDTDPIRARLAQDATAFWKRALALPNDPSLQVERQELEPATKQRLRDLGYLE